jgi:hypothetical protein
MSLEGHFEGGVNFPPALRPNDLVVHIIALQHYCNRPLKINFYWFSVFNEHNTSETSE